MWKKSGAWFFKGMPKQEKEEELPSPNLGEGHKKERRFTVYKPARTEKDELTEAEVEESSEDEATGELAKRGLSKLGESHSESDLSGPLSIVRCVQIIIRKKSKFIPGFLYKLWIQISWAFQSKYLLFSAISAQWNL